MDKLHILPGVEGVIFDCDGTLADSMPLHREAWFEAMEQFGCRITHEFLDPLNGTPSREIVEIYNRTFAADIDVVNFCSLKEELAFERLSRVRPIPEVVEFALELKGRIPMAVASGGVEKNVALILRAIGMDSFFDAIVTASDPVAPKPEPDIFLEAARRINVEASRCQVFEDGEMGFEAARRAGMNVTDIRPYLRKCR